MKFKHKSFYFQRSLENIEYWIKFSSFISVPFELVCLLVMLFSTRNDSLILVDVFSVMGFLGNISFPFGLENCYSSFTSQSSGIFTLRRSLNLCPVSHFLKFGWFHHVMLLNLFAE
jgi:hypothetical protein